MLAPILFLVERHLGFDGLIVLTEIDFWVGVAHFLLIGSDVIIVAGEVFHHRALRGSRTITFIFMIDLRLGMVGAYDP